MGYANLDAGDGVTMLNGQGEIDGHQLHFALSPVGFDDRHLEGLNSLDKAQMQRAVESFLPGAEVLAVHGENCNVASYSDWSWSTYRIGHMEYLSEMRKPEGRLLFAESDICRGWSAGWMAPSRTAPMRAQLDRLLYRD